MPLGWDLGDATAVAAELDDVPGALGLVGVRLEAQRSVRNR